MTDELNNLAREAAEELGRHEIERITLEVSTGIFETRLRPWFRAVYDLGKQDRPVEQFEFEERRWVIESWRPRPPKRGEVFMSCIDNKPSRACFDFTDYEIILRPVEPVPSQLYVLTPAVNFPRNSALTLCPAAS